jgi:hypothetical protein
MDTTNWRGVTCRRCKAPIVFVLTRKGTRMPVDAKTFDSGDTMFDPKKHMTHFATCSHPQEFRKRDHGKTQSS